MAISDNFNKLNPHLKTPGKLVENANFLIDLPTKTTLAQHLFSKINSGNNNLPDFIGDKEFGRSLLGNAYVDIVRFELSDEISTEEYVNSTILLSNMAKITQTYVNGRRNSVKQISGDNDWDITFSIKILSDFSTNIVDEDIEDIRKVGSGKDGLLAKTSRRLADGIFSTPRDIKYLNEGKPDDKIQNLVGLLNTFYSDYRYTNVTVYSKYLNDNFGIDKIVPYYFQTSQDHEYTNMYTVTIQAYSDISDDAAEQYISEIIPK